MQLSSFRFRLIPIPIPIPNVLKDNVFLDINVNRVPGYEARAGLGSQVPFFVINFLFLSNMAGGNYGYDRIG
jgi:hypothetical protein